MGLSYAGATVPYTTCLLGTRCGGFRAARILARRRSRRCAAIRPRGCDCPAGFKANLLVNRSVAINGNQCPRAEYPEFRHLDWDRNWTGGTLANLDTTVT